MYKYLLIDQTNTLIAEKLDSREINKKQKYLFQSDFPKRIVVNI